MKFKIHGEYADGTADSVIIEGDSMQELREIARYEVEKRGWSNYWSEEVEQ